MFYALVSFLVSLLRELQVSVLGANPFRSYFASFAIFLHFYLFLHNIMLTLEVSMTPEKPILTELWCLKLKTSLNADENFLEHK
jgi:hypothetical protein